MKCVQEVADLIYTLCSIEYWFRCMDLDGDGQISMYEMEWFYEEQMQKMEALGIERLPFEDCLCQVTFYTVYIARTCIMMTQDCLCQVVD